MSDASGRTELVAAAFASDDPRAALAAHVDETELDDLLDPTRYLGSAPVLVDRALARYRETA